MTLDLLRGRQNSSPLTNKSGGGVVEGDVVIVDDGNASAFTTTATEGYTDDLIGVALETIANDAIGRVCFGGYVAQINLDGAAALGDFIKTDGAAKQGTPVAASDEAGVFAQALTASATPPAIIFNPPEQSPVGAGAGSAIFTVEGTLTVASNPLRIYNLSGVTRTIYEVFLSSNTVPTGAEIIVDVHKDGVTIFTNQANRPTVAISGNTGNTTTIDVPGWADNEYLTMDVDQIGSVAAGADLTVHILYS